MILTKSHIKSFNIDDEIRDKINSGRFNEFLLIVPTNRKIRSLKRELISGSPNKATGKLNLETIGTYSTKLLSAKSNQLSILLSEAASTVLLRQSFQSVELKYFSYYKKEVQNHIEAIPDSNIVFEFYYSVILPETRYSFFICCTVFRMVSTLVSCTW